MDVHARDVVEKLKKEGVSSAEEFSWTSQMRCCPDDAHLAFGEIVGKIGTGQFSTGQFCTRQIVQGQIFWCKIVYFLILVPNCPFAFLMPNCQFLLFWCQIIRAPNCPTTLGKGFYDWDDDLVQKGGTHPLTPLQLEFVPKKASVSPSNKFPQIELRTYPKKHPFILNVEVLARQ